MSFFKLDTTNVNEGFSLIEEGNYEATIVNAVAGKTNAGKDKVTVDFEIRSDVNQKHQGQKSLFNMFMFEHEVSIKIVNSLLAACGFANNVEFTSPADLADKLFGKNLEIVIKHESYTNNEGQVKTNAKAKYYNKSKVDAPQAAGAVEVQDNDLPF